MSDSQSHCICAVTVSFYLFEPIQTLSCLNAASVSDENVTGDRSQSKSNYHPTENVWPEDSVSMNNEAVTKWPLPSEYWALVFEVWAVNQIWEDWFVGLLCSPLWVCPPECFSWRFDKWALLLALINSRDWIQTLFCSSWSPGGWKLTDEC